MAGSVFFAIGLADAFLMLKLPFESETSMGQIHHPEVNMAKSNKSQNWVVVSNMFYFHPYLGKIPILTHIFQMAWNHQLEKEVVSKPSYFQGADC